MAKRKLNNGIIIEHQQIFIWQRATLKKKIQKYNKQQISIKRNTEAKYLIISGVIIQKLFLVCICILFQSRIYRFFLLF